MTDSEKLDLLLTEMQNMNSRVDARMEKIEIETTGMNSRMEKIESETTGMNSKMEKIESETLSIKHNQLILRQDLREIKDKVNDTYNLALDAWGTSTENRVLINQL